MCTKIHFRRILPSAVRVALVLPRVCDAVYTGDPFAFGILLALARQSPQVSRYTRYLLPTSKICLDKSIQASVGSAPQSAFVLFPVMGTCESPGRSMFAVTLSGTYHMASNKRPTQIGDLGTLEWHQDDLF